MDAAKAAVFKHLSKDGHHHTDVEEHVKPAVQHEHVKPTEHENVYRPVDREVHQDHHHTTVQPIQHKEVLPEKHSHIDEGTEHKEFRHGDHSHIKDTIAEERTRLGLHEHSREVGSTTRTQAEAPTAQGEHVHHHIHEHVQPVIEKETVQPHVVHRTHGVHEVHHHEPLHHGASHLPPVTLDEFQKQGGHIEGEQGVRRDHFRGEPRPLESGYVGGEGARGSTHITREGEHGFGHHHGEVGTHGRDHEHRREPGSNGLGAGVGSNGLGHNGVSSNGLGHNGVSSTHGTHETPISDRFATQNASTRGPTTGTGASSVNHTNGHNGPTGSNISPTTSATSERKKGSLLDKLNPKKDSDGDGKAGFMK